MKKYSFMAGLLLLAAGCSNDVDMNVNSYDEYAQVSVRVNDFSLLVEDFPTTRAEQSVASYTGVKALTLAFYASNGSETYKTDQLRDDATTYTTFGEFSCNLPIGTYTMVVLGYGSETAITLTSPTEAAFDNDRVRETFAATQSVTVTPRASQSIASRSPFRTMASSSAIINEIMLLPPPEESEILSCLLRVCCRCRFPLFRRSAASAGARY